MGKKKLVALGARALVSDPSIRQNPSISTLPALLCVFHMDAQDKHQMEEDSALNHECDLCTEE